jgi:hypothetical protein
MKSTMRLASGWMVFTIVVVLAGWFLALPTPAVAQSQGNNAVYYQSGSSGTCCKGSGAFIDASMFKAQATDICGVIYYIFTHSYPSSGAVVDARGLNSSTTTMTCAVGTTPWNNGSSFVNVSSTVLLPAGTIVIHSTWVLPANTHLIGVGDGPSGTIVQVASGTSLTTMIQFGSSSACSPSGVCTGISVESLTLDGQAQSVDGIINQFAQDNSYVSHVFIYQILGTGLLVSSAGGGSSAANSGPYSDISFDTGGYSGISSTVCAQIIGLSGTLGIHGLNCTSETNDAPAAVLLDSSNNSIEDVRIVGFYDGIRVGANGNAQSNVLLNIIGDTTATGSPTPIIVVHITSSNTVTDLSVMGANNAGGSSGTITIADDLTGAQLVDTAVGVYALGKKSNGGYSRFTTSPSAATWGVGSVAPGSSCSPGSLYSNTSGSPKALYACLVGTSQWSAIK